MHDYQSCGGPRRCHYCRAILTESPEEACERIAAENRARGLRTASAFRAGVHMAEKEKPMKCKCKNCTASDAEALAASMPEDPYKAPVAARRAASGDDARFAAAHADDDTKLAAMAAFRENVFEALTTSRAAALEPATSKRHLEPPDPYAIAIERMKEKR